LLQSTFSKQWLLFTILKVSAETKLLLLNLKRSQKSNYLTHK
jgi:hypothetical protein